MKFLPKSFPFIALLAAILVLGGCDGDDPEKSQEELQLDKLRGEWTMVEVENDGIDRSDEYPGMVINLSGTYTAGGTYSLASTADAWPSVSPWKAADTWKFDAASIASGIVRSSDLQVMNYALSNGDQTLTISFSYSGTGFNNGRTESVGGDWTFTFSK